MEMASCNSEVMLGVLSTLMAQSPPMQCQYSISSQHYSLLLVCLYHLQLLPLNPLFFFNLNLNNRRLNF